MAYIILNSQSFSYCALFLLNLTDMLFHQQAEYELSRGSGARNKLNMETEYA